MSLRKIVKAIEENTDYEEIEGSSNTSTKHVKKDGTRIRIEIETRVADREW